MKLPGILGLLVLPGILGCAHSQYPQRWDMGTYFLISATPQQVSDHCRKRILKTGGKYDDGRGIGADPIFACTDYKRPDKPTVFISHEGRKWMREENCHATKADDAEGCWRKWMRISK